MKLVQYLKTRDYKKIIAILPDKYKAQFGKYELDFPEYIYAAYQQDILIGVIAFDGIKRIANLFLFVLPEFRKKGVASTLLKHVETIFNSHIKIEHSRFRNISSNNLAGIGFINNQGFRLQVSTYKMIRNNDFLSEPNILARNYEYDDYLSWHRIEETAFYMMRQNIGYKPSYYYPPFEKEKEDYFKDKDNKYVFFNNDENIIGIGQMHNNNIDTIAVAPEHQGKGYGRKITAYMINKVIAGGHEKVKLSVAKGNYAKELYENMGFVESGLEHHYVKYYRPDTRIKNLPGIFCSISSDTK